MFELLAIYFRTVRTYSVLGESGTEEQGAVVQLGCLAREVRGSGYGTSYVCTGVVRSTVLYVPYVRMYSCSSARFSRKRHMVAKNSLLSLLVHLRIRTEGGEDRMK